jgi:hypothetical protein
MEDLVRKLGLPEHLLNEHLDNVEPIFMMPKYLKYHFDREKLDKEDT